MLQIPHQSSSSALATAVLLACLTYCRAQGLPPIAWFPATVLLLCCPSDSQFCPGGCPAFARGSCAMQCMFNTVVVLFIGRLAGPQHHRCNLHHTECWHCRIHSGSEHPSAKPYASVRRLHRVQGQRTVCQVRMPFILNSIVQGHAGFKLKLIIRRPPWLQQLLLPGGGHSVRHDIKHLRVSSLCLQLQVPKAHTPLVCPPFQVAGLTRP